MSKGSGSDFEMIGNKDFEARDLLRWIYSWLHGDVLNERLHPLKQNGIVDLIKNYETLLHEVAIWENRDKTWEITSLCEIVEERNELREKLEDANAAWDTLLEAAKVTKKRLENKLEEAEAAWETLSKAHTLAKKELATARGMSAHYGGQLAKTQHWLSEARLTMAEGYRIDEETAWQWHDLQTKLDEANELLILYDKELTEESAEIERLRAQLVRLDLYKDNCPVCGEGLIIYPFTQTLGAIQRNQMTDKKNK